MEVEDEQEYKETVNFVPREEWGALEPRFVKKMTLPPDVIRLSHTGTDVCYEKQDCFTLLQDLQKKHMEIMNLPDIQWNFMVSYDGTIYEGRGWEAEGYKTPQIKKEFKDKTVAEISFIGDFKNTVFPLEMNMGFKRFIRNSVRAGLVAPKHHVTAMVRECSVFKTKKK